MGESDRKRGPLDGLVVLDLSRILAGPTATQLFGDLGADVIKVERPQLGDDTRRWGPPFVKVDGEDSQESAYYLSANRNKRSIGLNLASEEGQQIVRDLAVKADILVENYKVGDLARKGLDYETLSKLNPRLIYCSITGFGQTGPYAERLGYDFMIQGMGGIMSLTGEAESRPLKAGVGIADVMCGMYASNAVLAALHARHQTGKGQHIDIALLDTQVAWLINQGVGYLTSGEVPPRRGNGHPTIVPYDTFPGSDGEFIIAIGNDKQFAQFAKLTGREDLVQDPRFATNIARVENRDACNEAVAAITCEKSAEHWLALLGQNGIPCGPVNDLEQVFNDPQVLHRGMKIDMAHSSADEGEVHLIGNPINMSETPVDYRMPPPQVGEHSSDILTEHLKLDEQEIRRLRDNGIID